jgi:hypothetical protein
MPAFGGVLGGWGGGTEPADATAANYQKVLMGNRVDPATGRLLNLSASGGQFVDPATGQILRIPQNAEEYQEASRQADNAALTVDRTLYDKLYGEATTPANTEAAINKGTDELAAAQADQTRALTQRAAAAGAGADSGAITSGLQTLGSQFAGQKANLARDVRFGEEQDRRQRVVQMAALRPKVPTVDFSKYGRMFGGSGGEAAGSSGGGGVSISGGGGGVTPNPLRNDNELLDPLTRERTGEEFTRPKDPYGKMWGNMGSASPEDWRKQGYN